MAQQETWSCRLLRNKDSSLFATINQTLKIKSDIQNYPAIRAWRYFSWASVSAPIMHLNFPGSLSSLFRLHQAETWQVHWRWCWSSLLNSSLLIFLEAGQRGGCISYSARPKHLQLPWIAPEARVTFSTSQKSGPVFCQFCSSPSLKLGNAKSALCWSH